MTLAIRPLDESDLEDADRIFRLAFARFVGHPDPSQMFGDRDMIRARRREAPEAAIGAYRDGVLVGSNFATGWGSVGFFGPLTIHPDHWGQGIAPPLVLAALSSVAPPGLQKRGHDSFRPLIGPSSP